MALYTIFAGFGYGVYENLYIDKAKGIPTEQRFFLLTETLEQEQTDNKATMQVITDKLSTAGTADSEVRRFIEEIREYASITELGLVWKIKVAQNNKYV